MLVIVVRQQQFSSWLSRVSPGLLLTLLPAAWFQTEYNLATTDSRFLFPYVFYTRQYDSTPPFIFQSPIPEPEYRHEEMRRLYQEVAQFDKRLRSLVWLPYFVGFRFGKCWVSFGFLLWLLPFLALPEIWRNATMRGLLILWFSFLAVIQLTTWFFPHYAAPGWPA